MRFFRHSQRGQLFIKTHLSLLNLFTETGPIGSGSGVHLKVYVNFGVSCFSGGVLSKILTFDNHLLGHFNFKFLVQNVGHVSVDKWFPVSTGLRWTTLILTRLYAENVAEIHTGNAKIKRTHIRIYKERF